MAFSIDQGSLLAALEIRLRSAAREGAPISAGESGQIAELIRRAVSVDAGAYGIEDRVGHEEIDALRSFRRRYDELTDNAPSDPDNLTQPDDEALTAFLRDRTGSKTVLAANVQRLSDGNSKQTFAFDMIGAEIVTPLILRRDREASFVGTSVVQEFQFIKALFDVGFSVPEPMWLEQQAGSIAGTFLVSKRVAGEACGVSIAKARNVFGHDLVAVLADILARLHNLPIDDLKLPEWARNIADGEPIKQEINHWQNLYLRQVEDTSALLEQAFGWLLDNAPALGRPAIVHGDAGFHNLIVDRQGKATLIDWELAHIGDPATDVSGCRPFVEREGVSFQHFRETYESAGGGHLSSSSLRYHECFRLARDCSIIASGMELFNRRKSVDLRRMNNFHVFYEALLERLGDHLEHA